MASIDFTSLLVIVTPKHKRAEEAFAYPENAKRCWTENISADHTEAEELIIRKSGKASSSTTPAVYLHLYLTLEPKNLLKGFVFGTDEDTCDVLLHRSRTSGISGNHFSIQIDWDSGSPVLSCLTGRGVRLKEESTRQQMRTLSRDDAQTIPPGTTLFVEVIDGFELTVSCPHRGESQSTYNEKLKEYYGRYKDAVPDMSNVTLNRPDMTPFISRYYVGLNRGIYYTTQRMTTGDAEYDSKVFLYNTQRILAATENERTAEPDSEPIPPPRGKQQEGRPKHLATALSRFEVARPENATFSFSDSEKSRMYVIKHFRDVRGRWSSPQSRAQRSNRVQHLNVLRVVDFISMDTEFMVINEFLLHTTLDSILQDAARLSSAESGFVIGQVLEGLKYLHGQGWIHENLDPRSILVLAKDRLFVKVADFALSGMVDLGKPIGYHSEYASQKIAEKYDQYPMDIWSVGVVGLRLLKGVIPARPRFTLDRQCEYVVSLDRHVRSLSRTRSDDKGLRFLTRVLKSRYQDRPTATELLLDPWIQETKNYEVLQLPISQSITPQPPRRASVGPFNRGPSSIISRQSSKDRMARPLPNPTSPDDYNDFESEPGTPTSRSSKFTANPLALEPSLRSRTPMPFYSEDKSEIPSRLVGSPHSQSRISGGSFPVAYDEHGSATPPSRRSADSPSQTSHASTGYNADDELSILRGKGSSRSQSRSSTDRYGRREAQIEENGSEKMESAKSQGPVAKKARMGPAVPLSGVILRSRGKKPALRPSGRYTEG